jgi:ArsR family transcriptional regulator
LRIANTEIFELHAEFCSILANPTRLMILALLAKREMSVGEIAEVVNVRMANVSQNLSVLRLKNIVRSRKEGQMVYYSLVDQRLLDACLLIRSVLLDNLKMRGLIADDFDPEHVVVGD